MKKIALTFAAAAALSASALAADALAAPDAGFGLQQQGRGQGGREEARESRGGSETRSQGGRQEREKGGARGQEGRGRAQAGGSEARGSSGSRGSQARGSSGQRGSEARGGTANRAEGPGNNRSRGDGEARGSSSGRGNSAAARSGSGNGSEARGTRGNRSASTVLQGVVTRGRSRGLAQDAVNVRTGDGRVRMLNRRGDVLLDMDERRVSDLGSWQLRRLGDRRPTGSAPAFCRSGEGHPVHGREWCLDKGFGLGSRSGTLWSRGSIGDVIFRRRTDGDRLDRGGLIGVLGDVVFGRLALQSVALGYDQPLVGVWVAQPEGPRILRVRSGDREVAEFVDRDRDDRVEVLYVVQPL